MMGAVRSQSSWRRNGGEEKLRQMWVDEGKSGSQIAKALGVSRGSVMGKLHRLGLLKKQNRTTNQSREERRGIEGWCTVGWRRARKHKVKLDDLGVVPVAQSALKDTRVLPGDPEPHERVAFLDLQRNHCRFPLGDLFCGRERRDVNTPYCCEHHARAYRVVP